MGYWLVINGLANMSWILLWQYEMLGLTLLVMLFALVQQFYGSVRNVV